MDHPRGVDESDQELDLSCGSSSVDECEGGESTNAIAPYQFEPYASDGDSEESEGTESDDSNSNSIDRLQNNAW